MPEPQIMFEVPPEEWKQKGEHQAFRLTTPGKIENLGPSQPYTHPVTKEVRNQHFKYANVTDTPIDWFLNIIPGMHPFQWDLLSLGVTIAAPGLGVIDGILDNKHNEIRYAKFKGHLGDIDTKLRNKLFEKAEDIYRGNGGETGGGNGGTGDRGEPPTGNGPIPPRNIQPGYNITFGFNSGNYTDNSLNMPSYGHVSFSNNFSYGSEKIKRRRGTKATKKWTDRFFKDVQIKTRGNSEALLTSGPALFLKGDTDYNSRKSILTERDLRNLYGL